MRVTKCLLAVVALCAALAVLSACTGSSGEGSTSSERETPAVTEPLTAEATQSATDVPTDLPEDTTVEEPTEPVYDLCVADPADLRSAFRLVYDTKAENAMTLEADMVANLILTRTGAHVRTADAGKQHAKEIVLGSRERPESAALLDSLAEGEYAIRTTGDRNGNGQILVAATTYRGYVTAVEYLLDQYYSPDKGFCIPTGLNLNGREREYTMITTDIEKLRDPCILVEDGVYYAYGTGWTCYKNTSGKLDGPWVKIGTVASVADPSTDGGSHWAPEVHKYNGAYYMFTTYYNAKTNHRGCTVMKSDSPEGPFVEITGGHVTPADWDAIDGTLYVDPDGQPWMVFVHEWTCMPNGVGSFAAAKLSDDLTHFISEPMELFLANEPSWAVSGVTDGCWMYTTAEGELLMIWSNFDAHGYVVAVARSSNGRLDGEWIHEKELLYSKYMTGTYDGGHGMIFTDTDGQMYLSFHSPNTAEGGRKERPTLLAIKEENGKLVWDEPKSDNN